MVCELYLDKAIFFNQIKEYLGLGARHCIFKTSHSFPTESSSRELQGLQVLELESSEFKHQLCYLLCYRS